MFHKLLVAVDSQDDRSSVLEFAGTLARHLGAGVDVLHCREFAGRGCAAPLETLEEAQYLVDDAVFGLRMDGVGADGAVRPACLGDIASVIVDVATGSGADLVVLGARRRRRFRRLFGDGLTQRVLRTSPVPVVIEPATRKGTPVVVVSSR